MEIEEGKERSAFFKRLNSNLDKLVSLASRVLINSDPSVKETSVRENSVRENSVRENSVRENSVRESLLSALRNQAGGASSILQEAFAETINGN